MSDGHDEIDTQVAWLRRELDELKAECPYWSDGRHCYTANIGNSLKHVSKWCYCGAKVKPR